jgi:peptidoglycan/xylan/chitin deacetylase (PgdA/CDA1 family)
MRKLIATLVLGIAALGAPPPAVAGPCVRFTSSIFNAPGDDNVMPGLNGEWVQLTNGCSTTASLAGYSVRDYGAAHVYRFRSTFRLAPGASVRLHSGTGTNTAANLYWGRTRGEVWNNTPPEWAYLVNSSGTIVSSWSWSLARVVSHGSRTVHQIALTIDDGYNVSICQQLLTILEREHVAATFFPVSHAIASQPAFYRAVVAAGFPIGDHTVNHPHLPALSIAQQYSEIATARTRVESILGTPMLRALRPPYGEYDTDTRRAAKAAGVATMVTWETTFGVTSSTATLAQQIGYAMRVQNGSVVLMHCNARTPAILQAVIPRYKALGYRFVTIGQMFGLGGAVPKFG